MKRPTLKQIQIARDVAKTIIESHLEMFKNPDFIKQGYKWEFFPNLCANMAYVGLPMSVCAENEELIDILCEIAAGHVFKLADEIVRSQRNETI